MIRYDSHGDPYIPASSNVPEERDYPRLFLGKGIKIDTHSAGATLSVDEDYIRRIVASEVQAHIPNEKPENFGRFFDKFFEGRNA